jgi:hypothetical protein
MELLVILGLAVLVGAVIVYRKTHRPRYLETTANRERQ